MLVASATVKIDIENIPSIVLDSLDRMIEVITVDEVLLGSGWLLDAGCGVDCGGHCVIV